MNRFVMYKQWIIIIGLILPTFTFAINYNPPGGGLQTIVIDAGHGGKDGTTRGKFSREKDVALQVALKLGKAIEKELPGIQVIFTRKTDVFIELYQRIGIANANKADLFISIHCNSMPITRRGQNTRINGTETFVSGYNRLGQQDVAIRENASMLLEENYKENYQGFDPKDPESYIIFSLMKNQFRNQSIRFATLIQDEYISSGRVDRGVKEQSLAVLAAAGMPAVLTEIGFISNPEEERYMNSSAGQAEIVKNLVNAIKKYKSQLER